MIDKIILDNFSGGGRHNSFPVFSKRLSSLASTPTFFDLNFSKRQRKKLSVNYVCR